MAVITKIPFNSHTVNISVERFAKRSAGIHLSSIIKDRLITAGIERKTKGKPFTPEEQHLLFQRGFLWERMVSEFVETEEWLQHQLEMSSAHHFAEGQLEVDTLVDKQLIRPGECMLDGVYMTPDAIHIGDFRVEEWKCTAMRAKGFDIEARRPEWLWQGAAYAKVFGMTKAFFRIWHINDNKIEPWLVEWTQEEVDTNWARLLEHYQIMRDRDAGRRTA